MLHNHEHSKYLRISQELAPVHEKTVYISTSNPQHLPINNTNDKVK